MRPERGSPLFCTVHCSQNVMFRNSNITGLCSLWNGMPSSPENLVTKRDVPGVKNGVVCSLEVSVRALCNI
jgi:hypothetical protein